MIKKYKNYLLGVIGLLLTLTMLVGIKYLMQPKYEELPEVKLINIKDNKSFAIMVQNGDSYEEYTSEDNTWPGADYVFKEAKCTDNSGALVDNAITFADGKATLTTNQTIYCTLYFDEKPTIDILRENDSGKYLSTDLQGGMYRYQGTNDVPNWICFGTKSKDECINEETGVDKYMYRIIGITEEGQLYLIKETFLKEGTQKTFAWNDKYSVDSSSSYYCDDGICPEWNTSLLFKRINGTSNGTETGSGQTLNKEWTDIFVDSAQYDYLKSGDEHNGGEASEWYNLIADHEWMYGDTNVTPSTVIYNGKNIYDIETGQTETTHYAQNPEGSTTVEQQTYTWSEKVKAKISLMYLHDVAYAYYDGSQDSTRGNPGSNINVKNSWIHFQKDGYNTSPSYEWLSTRWGVHSASGTGVSARYVNSNGSLDYDFYLYFEHGVRPVFYLSSEAEIVDGDGAKDSPFILK